MLNVYTPSVDNVDNPLPVMVWIHGGGWFTGSGNGETDLYGPGYLLDRDIVLVTINYRLGPLGKINWTSFKFRLNLIESILLRIFEYGRCGRPWKLWTPRPNTGTQVIRIRFKLNYKKLVQVIFSQMGSRPYQAFRRKSKLGDPFRWKCWSS